VRLIVFLGVLTMVILATGISAGAAPDGNAQTTQADIAAAQQHLADLRANASIAQAKYDNALTKMNDLNTELAKAEKDLKASEKRLSEAQNELDGRAAQVYKSGDVAFIDVLMGTDNFQDFATRLELWTRLLGEQQAEVQAVRKAKQNLEDRKSALETQKARRVDAVEEALANKKQADQDQTEAKAYLDSLNGDLQTAIKAEQQRKAEAAAAKAPQNVANTPDPAPDPKPVAQPVSQPDSGTQQSTNTPDPKPVAQPASQPDSETQQAAAERAAAAQAAAEQAKHRADLADQRASQREADQQARDQAQTDAEQAAVEAAAAEQARAEERAAQHAAERKAARQAAADHAAQQDAASASASADPKKVNNDASASADPKKGNNGSSASAGGRKNDASSTATATSTASPSALKSGKGSVGGGDGEAVVADGEQYLGTPYLLGGLPQCVPFKTMDCSCFTMTVFSDFGISLPDSPGGQMGSGTPVDGDPIAGDLLFWSEDGSGVITHVGIAMGNGMTIHASNYAGFVTETPIDDVPGYVGAERLVGGSGSGLATAGAKKGNNDASASASADGKKGNNGSSASAGGRKNDASSTATATSTASPSALKSGKGGKGGKGR
jgi:cell wall-associated NlpC family hydrolase